MLLTYRTGGLQQFVRIAYWRQWTDSAPYLASLRNCPHQKWLNQKSVKLEKGDDMREERKQSVLRIAEVTQYPGTFESLSLPYASWPACRLRREDKNAEFAVPVFPNNRSWPSECTSGPLLRYRSCQGITVRTSALEGSSINSSWRPACCSFRLGSAHSKGRRLNVYM